MTILQAAVSSWLLAAAVPAQGDALEPPPELRGYIETAVPGHLDTRAHFEALVEVMFRPQGQGGLGLTYDNSYTRTVAEVWRDRKANCLSLTAFLVVVGRLVRLPVQCAEVGGYQRWERVGAIIRSDRHMVALISGSARGDLVVDFDPRVRPRFGSYVVAAVPENRLRALFHCNRAAELLRGEQLVDALEHADQAITADPGLSIAWNTRGAIHKAAGRLAEAEQSYRKARLCDPRDTTVINNLEVLLREVGRAEEAARFRELGHKLRQRDPYFHAFLAEEALQAGDLLEARRRVRRARRLHQTDAEFLRLEARILMAQGRPDQAAKALAKADGLRPFPTE